jgi:hypothetical protein
MVAALIVLFGEMFANTWFFTLGFGSRVVAGLGFQVFSWACMFGAVMLVTPARRYWASALMCALALTVALHVTLFLAGLAEASANATFNSPDALNIPYLAWIAALAVFPLPLWPIWRWYDGLMRALASR